MADSSTSTTTTTGPTAGTAATTTKIRRFDAGSRTVEGNVSGSRAALLEKERIKEREKLEQEKEEKIQRLSSNIVHSLSHSFRTATKSSIAEQNFANQTVGLVSAQEFIAAVTKSKQQQYQNDKNDDKEEIDNNESKQQQNDETKEEQQKREKAERKAQKRKLKEKKRMLSTLSFAGEEEQVLLDNDINNNRKEDEKDKKEQQQEEDDKKQQIITKRSKKDPTVDTSFLHDPYREEQIRKERERLQKEWITKQNDIKQEKLEITYSYWDGSGHRRTIQCKKGDTIGTFLQLTLEQQLRKEFRHLMNRTSDELIYVKEDLILPHDVTFYDLIATKARGKSGPLFYFHVADDIRVGPIDNRIEKEDSHPGKVIDRQWYERNKHIFPACRWQIYDPTMETYGSYTIGGK